MKSVRLDAETERQLTEAADMEGVTESEFIRAAVRHRAEQVLGETLDGRLADVLGAIRSKGGRARRAHDRFVEVVKKEGRSRRS